MTYLKKVVRGVARVSAGPEATEPRPADRRRRVPPTFADVNRDVLRTLEPAGQPLLRLDVRGRPHPRRRASSAWTYQICFGMGAAGKRTPQMWAMYITTFVFWIGIGHAGTLISAVLYLFRAQLADVDLPRRPRR